MCWGSSVEGAGLGSAGASLGVSTGPVWSVEADPWVGSSLSGGMEGAWFWRGVGCVSGSGSVWMCVLCE